MSDISTDFSSLQRDAFGEVKLVHRMCPLCSEANGATPPGRYSLGQWAVKTCHRCSFTYIDTAPDYTALFQQMSWDKTSKVETQWRQSTRAIQQNISKNTRWRLGLFPRKKMPDLLARYAERGNVLDLGCGDGGQMEGLSVSFVPHGIEISQEGAAEANARFGAKGGYAINAPCLDGLREFPAEFFTAATLRSYLEHELHPAEVLSELHRTLKPGGLAIVKVPNFACGNRRVMGRRWCGFRHPDHLNYFTPATLRQMAQNCGYSTRFPLTWRLPTGDNMWALLTKNGAVQNRRR